MPEWRTDMDKARAYDGKFFIGLWVWHGGLKEWSWDVDLAWIDESTNEIDVECSCGWDLEDYTAWYPAIWPKGAPTPMPAPMEETVAESVNG